MRSRKRRISTFGACSYSAKWAKSRPALANNRPNFKKFWICMFYQNKKGLNMPKNHITLFYKEDNVWIWSLFVLKKMSTVNNLCLTSLLISFLNIRLVFCLRVYQGQLLFLNVSRSAHACTFKSSRLFNLQNSCFHINFFKFVRSFSCFIIVTLLTYISYSFLSIKNIA